jgi:hypothetical protein
MAKIPQGINGPIWGSVGSVVGSSWKKEPYIKKKYKNRTKKVTQKELGNRSKFGASQSWVQPITGFVREGFKKYTERVEGFLAAKSYLSHNAWEGTGPDMRINPALMKVSYGNLPLSGNIAVEKTVDNHLQFTWDTNYVEGSSPNDQVMLLAYDIEGKKAYSTTTGQFRRIGTDTLTISATGRTYHIYLAFTAADRSRQSDSVYLGAISI